MSNSVSIPDSQQSNINSERNNGFSLTSVGNDTSFATNSRWPLDASDAQSWHTGPYTPENAAILLANDSFVVINGWPIRKTPNGHLKTNGSLNSHPVTHSDWPKDNLEAYERARGPYTIDNATTFLDQEPIEIYNGWLVWKAMTDHAERRALSNLQDMLSLSARKAKFGQAMPDNMECLLDNGDVVKPDASLISWQRVKTRVLPHGSNERPVLRGGPELVIEARSPSNTRASDRRKRTDYFRNEAQVVWDVDEANQCVWVYRATSPEDPTYFGAEDELDCLPFLPKWKRNVAHIFAEELAAEVAAGEVAVEWKAEARAEGVAEGHAEGMAEGHAVGVAEGHASAMRQMLPMLVKAQFGQTPSADLAELLADCNLEKLQFLQSQVESAASLDEWLALIKT